MIKILHSADWHLDAPLSGHGSALRQQLQQIPQKLLELCQQERCDLVLLCGDLFDGAYTAHTYQAVCRALSQMQVPVFISPGNHDFCGSESPWTKELWPDNVHIFKSPAIESVAVPHLDLRVYGAGYTAMDCPALLEGFAAAQQERFAVGVLHGDPTQVTSPYCPIRESQVAASKLDYLALGHIHKAASFTAGNTLCAWSGCPMGRGYDEAGIKGAYIVTLEETPSVQFRALDTPRFYDLQCHPDALGDLLPPVGSEDYYRVTLIGQCESPDLNALKAAHSRFPNLVLRDKTAPLTDLWGSAGEDSFEGVFFGLLRQMAELKENEEKEDVLLAAKLSRALLDGQEVVLP